MAGYADEIGIVPDRASARDILRRATELDARRLWRISNQVDAINRLLAASATPEGASYGAEMAALHERLALAERRSQLLIQQLRSSSRAWGRPEALALEAVIAEVERITNLPGARGSASAAGEKG